MIELGIFPIKSLLIIMLWLIKYSESDESNIKEILTDCVMANYGYEIFLDKTIPIGNTGKHIVSVGFRNIFEDDIQIVIRFNDRQGRLRQILLTNYLKHYPYYITPPL